MKNYNDQDMKRLSWYGLKPVIASMISFPPVNFFFRSFARRFLSKSTAMRFPVSAKSGEYRLLCGSSVSLLEPARDEVARNLYWGGGRLDSKADQHVLCCVEILCARAQTFLDIGAYSGLFALVAARSNPGVKSVSFEIVPENHLMLVGNLIHNDLIGRVDARLCGLADEPGWMTMPPALRLDRLASSMSIGSNFEAGVQIPLTTLDLAMADFKGPIVMKIDVEGFESSVLKGGQTFLETHRPDIVCEILASSTDHDEIGDTLGALGYQYYLFSDDGLIHCEQIDPTLNGRDWLFTMRRDLEDIILVE